MKKINTKQGYGSMALLGGNNGKTYIFDSDYCLYKCSLSTSQRVHSSAAQNINLYFPQAGFEQRSAVNSERGALKTRDCEMPLTVLDT